MRPSIQSSPALSAPPRAHRAHLAWALLTLVGAAALGFGAQRAQAQRPAQLDFGPYLNRYGTRWVVHVPDGGSGANASLKIVNAGWLPTNVAIVVLPAVGRADCAATQPQPIAVRCVQSLAPKTAVDMDVSAASEANVFIYSLIPGGSADCDAFAIAVGGTSLGAWEAAAWKAAPGEALAVGGTASDGGDSVGLSATATTGLGELYRGQPGGAGGGRRATILAQTLAFAPATGQTSLTNVDANCARVDVRSGSAGSAPECSAPRQATIEIAPFVAAPVAAVSGQSGQRSVWAAAADETVASASWRDGDGWAGYSSVGARETDTMGGKLAFPLAMAGLSNERSILWVSNLHPTATAQVDINMWDANGTVLRFHGDDVGICPGGTKAYDIKAIAGEIPPMGGADAPPERQGLKLLSLRVESRSTQLPVAPPIAGALIVQGDEGTEVVPGFGLPLILSRVSGRQLQATGAGGERPRGEARSITVIAGAMNQFGPERRTTIIAVTSIGDTRVENAAAADIYDVDGKLLIGGVGVRAGAATGYLDLSRPMRQPGGGMTDPPTQPFRLPVGFIGTVVLRAAQGRGATFGAVAVTRPMQPNGRPAPAPASGESFTVSLGSIVPLFVDPTVPTRTPVPTRPPVTPTVAGEPTSASTAVPTIEATPTAGNGDRITLWLPNVLNLP